MNPNVIDVFPGMGSVSQLTGVQTRVDQGEISQVARSINGDGRLLAITLQEGGLSRGEQNALIKELISSDHVVDRLAIYSDVEGLLSREEQRVIAEAVDHAYVDGAIDQSDLLKLSDFNGAGNGAQRLVSLLDASTLASRPGGSIEALGQALLERANANPGSEQATLDYYGAAVAFSQGREIQARNRGTASERIAMFEAAVQINENGFNGIGELHRSWMREGLATAGRLFADNAQLITDHFTALGSRPEVLSRFFAQTVLNPDIRVIPLDHRRDLISSVNNALGQVSGTYINRAENASSQLGQEEAMRALGALAGSLSGAGALALTEYSDEIKSNEAFRDEVAGLLSASIAPLFKSLPAPLSTVAGNATKDLGAVIIDQFIGKPGRPDSSVVGEFIDALEISIRQFEVENGYDGLLTAFQASRAAETDDIGRDLNVNLGGHRE